MSTVGWVYTARADVKASEHANLMSKEKYRQAKRAAVKASECAIPMSKEKSRQGMEMTALEMQIDAMLKEPELNAEQKNGGVADLQKTGEPWSSFE